MALDETDMGLKCVCCDKVFDIVIVNNILTNGNCSKQTQWNCLNSNFQMKVFLFNRCLYEKYQERKRRWIKMFHHLNGVIEWERIFRYVSNVKMSLTAGRFYFPFYWNDDSYKHWKPAMAVKLTSQFHWETSLPLLLFQCIIHTIQYNFIIA